MKSLSGVKEAVVVSNCGRFRLRLADMNSGVVGEDENLYFTAFPEEWDEAQEVWRIYAEGEEVLSRLSTWTAADVLTREMGRCAKALFPCMEKGGDVWKVMSGIRLGGGWGTPPKEGSV